MKILLTIHHHLDPNVGAAGSPLDIISDRIKVISRFNHETL